MDVVRLPSPNELFAVLKCNLEHRTGIDINFRVTDNGFTSLHLAALHRRLDIVNLLLVNGATVDPVDSLKKKTPLHLACERGFADIAAALLRAKANVNAVSAPERWTPLHLAAENGSVEVVKLLLTNNAKIDAVMNEGATPLFIAAQHGHVDVVKLLLGSNANVDAATGTSNTPLHIACDRGHESVVAALLASGASPDLPDVKGTTPLYAAVEQGRTALVKLLLANQRVDANGVVVDGPKSLYFAASRGYVGIVSALLEARVDANSVSEDGSTSLNIAAQAGHASVASLLLENHANVNAANDDRWTPLHGAAQNGHGDVVSVLLSHQADVNAAEVTGITPLQAAAQEAHVGVVVQLIASQADVNAVEVNGMTALFGAAAKGHADVVAALLENQAAVDAADNDGWTPLHIATKHGHVSVVSVLLEKGGADVNAADRNRQTPLHLAASLNCADVVPVLLANQANVDARDVIGSTPLHAAAHQGHAAVVELLLKSHANTSIPFLSGETPLFNAVSNGHASIVDLLLSHLAAASVQEEGVETSAQGAQAIVNAANRDGWTPLHLAARRGDVGMVKTLLANHASVNAALTPDGMCATPLHIAAAWGHAGVVSTLLTSGAEVNAAAARGVTPLHFAAQNGRALVVAVLLARQASVEVVSENGSTPLHDAARAGNLNVVSALLKKNAQVDAASVNGVTPLHFAAKEGHTDVATALLASQANLDAATASGVTPLQIAAQNGRISMVQVLLAAQPILDRAERLQTTDSDGNTPVLAAAKAGHFDVVKALVEAGASPSGRAGDGETVLTAAARQNNQSAVSLLSEFGCLTPIGTKNERQSLLSATLQALREPPRQTHEFQTMWLHVVDRLESLSCRLEDAQGVTRETIYQFTMVVFRLVRVKAARMRGGVFSRLLSSPSVAARFRDFHTELTSLERQISPDSPDSATSRSWKAQNAADDEAELLACFREKIEDAVSFEAIARDEGNSFFESATSIRHFVREHGDKVSHELLELLELSSRKILGFLESTEPQVPVWFIPSHDLEIYTMWTSTSEGATYTTSAKWLSSDVSVSQHWMQQKHTIDTAEKAVALQTRFVSTVERIAPLRHTHVIKVYGAWHLHLPFLAAFENVSHTNLREYLAREENKRERWQKLLETVQGLTYLFEQKLFFASLRCEHIWVGTDGVAKINALGACTSSYEDSAEQRVRWMAPETVRGEAPTAASSIYSFGVCMYEALSGEIPWGDRSADLVRSDILGGFRPQLPDGTPDAQIKFLERMWLTDPSKRPSIAEVVAYLEQLADAEKQKIEARGDYKSADESAWIDLERFMFPEWSTTMKRFVEKLKSKVKNCRESREAAEHIFKRIESAFTLVQTHERKQSRAVVITSLRTLLQRFNDFLRISISAESVLLRAKSQKVALQSNKFHIHLDELLALLAPTAADPIHAWKQQHETLAERGEVALTDGASAITVGNTGSSEPVPEASEARAVAIVRYEAERLNQRFKDLAAAEIDAAKAAASDNEAPRPAWLIRLHELDYNNKGDSIGKGSFGKVYRATWRGTPAVVKIMGDENDEDASSHELFFHELRVWFPLSHPHVIRLLGACHVGKRFFVCEFAGNGALDAHLKTSDENADRSWQLLHQVGLGLKYLHEANVLHNDLKCDNVLLGSNGDAKIIDFGLSSILNSAEVKVSQKKVGAVQWKSPEYLRGDRLTLASDIYAFAMCILEATTRQHPWGSMYDVAVRHQVKNGNLPQKPECLSGAQWSLIEMMCAANPAERMKISSVVEKLHEFMQQKASARKESVAASEPAAAP